MSAPINLSTLNCNIPSICIPRTFSNIDEKRIRNAFDALDFGTIDRVDIVPKQNEKGEKFNRVFVHFIEWNDTPKITEARQRLLSGQEVKLVYDNPWFWKISALRSQKNTAPIVRLRRPTRTTHAEAFDYGPNGEMVPYVSPKTRRREFVIKHERASEQPVNELKESNQETEKDSNPMNFYEHCDCCFCQR